jgi:hypothetical protein
MGGNDARALELDEERVVGRLVSALRLLEESRTAQTMVPGHVIFILGALDRLLSDAERLYVAMVFAGRKEQREELTVLMVDKLSVSRGVAVAGIRIHLESTFTPTECGTVPRAIFEYLSGLRAGVLSKAASLT